MPSSQSAKKRLRQNVVHRLRNRSAKSSIRTQLRCVREAVKAGDIEKAELEYREAAKRLDRAGARNLIHPNAAARSKSRLQKLIKQAKQAGSPVTA